MKHTLQNLIIICVLHSAISCTPKQNVIPYDQIIKGTLELSNVKEKWGGQVFNGKTPIIIMKNDVVKQAYDIEVFDYPVKYLTNEEILKQNVKVYIKFTKIERDEDQIISKYEVPVLGAFAGAIFTDKGGGVWTPDWVTIGFY